MKANKLLRITLLLLVVAGVLPMQAATVNIPTADGQYISWNDATLGNCSIEDSGAGIGSTRNGSTATFSVNNSTLQDYYLSFKSGAKDLAAKVSMTLSNDNGYSHKEEFDISNTGAWTPSEIHGAWFTNVPTGELTLTFKVESTTGSYAGNYGSLALRTSDGIPTIPGSIDIKDGSYVGARLENDGDNVGYVSNNTSATYTFRVTQAGVYKMTIPMTRYGDGTITTVVTDKTTGDEEANGTWTMTNPSNYEDTDIIVEGELTTGIKTLTMDFATAASFLCNYKSFTMTHVADHFARISSLAVSGQTTTKGTDSNWYCQLPADAAATTTFSIGKSSCTVTATAMEGDAPRTVTDNGDGTFTLPTPAPGAITMVTLTLTPDADAISGKTEYTLKLFRIGDISLTALTIDGIDTAILLEDLNNSQSASLNATFTAEPVVKATVVDGTVITGTNTISGNTVSVTLHAEMAGNTKDYTLTLNGLHLYNKTTTDETVTLKYTSEDNDKTNKTWSNGLYSLSPVGDGWNNSGFKLSKNDNPFTLSVPSDVVVKQFIIHEFKDNYTPGSLDAITSDGATAYIPYKHDFDNTNKYDLTVNLDGHQAGQPIVFSFTGGSQITGWYELTIEHQAITTAPAVVSTDVKVVNNHAVVSVTFDREMTATTATINGQSITAEGGSATLVFPVWGLEYDHHYTLSIAAGAAVDTYGNANTEVINTAVNTDAKPVVAKVAYDYVVSDVDEFKAAFAAVKSTNNNVSASRKTIFIKNGDYDFGSDEQRLDAYNVSLIGESRDGVVLHGNRDGISNPVLNLRDRSGFYLQDLTVRNDKNYGKDDKVGVGVAIYGGDKTVMKNVRMLSNQDTQVTGHRAYFENCQIHGTVDFICGGGDNYYYHTDLVLEDRGGNVIAAPSTSASLKWGYVFQQCTISAADGATAVTDGSYNLGRPWQDTPRAYYLNTRMNVKPSDNGWAGMGTLPTYFYEYGSTDKDGNEIDLTVRGNSPTSTNSYTPVLTTDEADKFTIENVFGGTDSWLPTEECVTVAAPTATLDGSSLSWTSVDDARCYVVFKNGQYLTNTTATTLNDIDEGVYTVRAANLNGGLGEESNTVLKRNITAGKWGTIVLPFAMTESQLKSTFGNDVKVAELTAGDATTLTFSSVAATNANQPYAIKVASDFAGAAISGVTIENGTPEQTVGDWTFVGSYADVADIPVGAYFFSANKLVKAGTGNTMKSTRAYLVNGNASAPALNIIFDGETTGITTTDFSDYTDKAGATFDLQGRKIKNAAQKGVYIVNGKKVIK